MLVLVGGAVVVERGDGDAGGHRLLFQEVSDALRLLGSPALFEPALLAAVLRPILLFHDLAVPPQNLVLVELVEIQDQMLDLVLIVLLLEDQLARHPTREAVDVGKEERILNRFIVILVVVDVVGFSFEFVEREVQF